MKDLRPDAEGGLSRTSLGGLHVLIIGGGASGVMMAAHLLSRPEAGIHVTIVEGRHMLGCGVAYSTTDPDHLLNTRVQNMSAYPDQPHHFRDWLRPRPGGEEVTDQCFVSRATYGAYMTGLLEPWSTNAGDGRLRCVMRSCLRLRDTPHGVAATLDDGQVLIGDIAVLATGHVQPAPDELGAMTVPWAPQEPVEPDSRVVIVGTGLTMVDTVLSLLKSGHRGPILSISRRGLLPRDHAATVPLALTLDDLPFDAPMSSLLRRLRSLAMTAEAQGGTWRDAVDGVRPHVRRLWRSLAPAERARFLRHGVTWWDVHRHRIPPASASVIKQAMQSGQLTVQRARFLSANLDEHGVRQVTFRPVGTTLPVTRAASRIIDCRGIRRDPEHHATPLIADLLATGQARVDGLRISLDVTGDCQLIQRDGMPSRQIFAIGPASRAAFWEITAIPDIREQVAQLAGELTAIRVARRR